MTDWRNLAAASYVSLESYRRDGKAVATPVWITAEAGKLYCWTLKDSGKVKRIRANPQVRLAVCDARGKLKGDWVTANAQALDSPATLKSQRRRMRAKYGLKFLAYRFVSALSRADTTVIAFQPAENAQDW